MAYAYLGRMYDGLGESETAAQDMAKAYELRDSVSDRENYFITFNYHRQVTRNLELARQTLESWAQKYPRYIDAHGLMSGFTSQGVGRYEKAVEAGQKAIELAPDLLRSGPKKLIVGVYSQGRLVQTIRSTFIGPRE